MWFSSYKHLSRFIMQLISSEVTAYITSSIRLNCLLRHSVTVWFIVCSTWPQSQAVLFRNPHLCKRALHQTRSVCSPFNVDQVLLWLLLLFLHGSFIHDGLLLRLRVKINTNLFFNMYNCIQGIWSYAKAVHNWRYYVKHISCKTFGGFL